jgi:hypothetical protein
MDENPILPARFFFFFSTSSLPQNFPPSYLPPTSPLLPTTYQPLPLTPSPELLAPETLSGSELGAWSRLGARASLEFGMSLELGATTAGPTQDPGKHFSLCCFFFVLQEKKKKKKAMASPSSSSLCRGACNSELAAASSELRRAPELAATQASELLQSLLQLKLRSFGAFLELAFLSCSKLRAPESSGACRAPDRFGACSKQAPSSGACCSKLRARSKQAPNSKLVATKLRSLLLRACYNASSETCISPELSFLSG